MIKFQESHREPTGRVLRVNSEENLKVKYRYKAF